MKLCDNMVTYSNCVRYQSHFNYCLHQQAGSFINLKLKRKREKTASKTNYLLTFS